MTRVTTVVYFTQLGVSHALGWPPSQFLEHCRAGKFVPDRALRGLPVWHADTLMGYLAAACAPQPGGDWVEGFKNIAEAYRRGITMGGVFVPGGTYAD